MFREWLRLFEFDIKFHTGLFAVRTVKNAVRHTMRPHDGCDDGQADPSAAVGAGTSFVYFIEAFPYMWQIRRGNAVAVVVYGDAHPVVADFADCLLYTSRCV